MEVKFRHNINELSMKNIQFSAILKELVIKEQQDIGEECEVFKKMIDTCISLQDSLTSLDTLEKKTSILKEQVNSIKDSYISRKDE